jgi:8-oxo-dGTP pyrophosphatase MutT (NUDIX family)
MDEIKHWLHLGTETLATTKVFDLLAHRRVSQQTGSEAEFYVLDVVDWVNVVALTDDDRLVLVEQYRHGVERTTLEIPGGMVDRGDASPEAAARRELLEETGFASDHWRLIGTVDPNPAIQSNRCYTFLAERARKVAEPAPDGLEELRLVLEPARRVPDLLRTGRIEHALVVAALMWWRLASEE